MFGYEPHALTGMPIEVLVPERLRAAHESHRARFLAHPARRPMGSGLNLVGRRRDGTEIPIDVSLSPLEGPGPEESAVIAVVRDVTDRRRAEERAALLAAIVDSSDDAIVSVDPDLAVTSWNPGAERLLGRSADRALGERPSAVGLPEEHFQRALAGEPVVRAETLVVRPDGATLHASLTITPIAVGGSVVGAAAIVRDVTEQHAAMAALAAAGERLREGEILARVGTWEWHVPSGAVQWSAGMHALLGVDPLGFGGTLADHLARMHPDDRGRFGRLLAAAAEGHSFELEHRALGPGGTEIWLMTRAEPRGDDATGTTVRAVSQDVTERRRAREALQEALDRERQATEALREADRLKDEFLSVVSHELRTPLTAVLGFATILHERGAAPTELVEPIVRNAHEMRRMIEQLLDFSHLAAGRAEVRLVAVELRTAVEDTLARVAHALADHDLQVSIEPGLEVLADEHALRVVLANLITNAATFAPSGTVIDVEGQRAGPSVTLRVRDRGPGVPADLRDRLFERFARGADHPPGRHGTGIGLAIAHRYVELMGGRIWHEEPAGGGACFAVSLPAAG